jgi:hypothetical protein
VVGPDVKVYVIGWERSSAGSKHHKKSLGNNQPIMHSTASRVHCLKPHFSGSLFKHQNSWVF